MSASAAGLRVTVHPLVIVNISDHYTRVNSFRADVSIGASTYAPQSAARGIHAAAIASSSGARMNDTDRAWGALLGKLQDNNLEITTSFELKLNTEGLSFDVAFREKRIDQYRKIFPESDIVGWYAVEEHLVDGMLNVQRDMMLLNENVILLQLRPSGVVPLESTSPLAKSLPIKIYESDVPPTRFSEVCFGFHSTDSERIAVDHVIRHAVTDDDSDASTLTRNFAMLDSTLKMFEARVDVLKNYLDATERGEVPWDASLLRMAAKTCDELPRTDAMSYSVALGRHSADTKIVAYLSGITKTLCLFNGLIDKYNFAHERLSRSWLPQSHDPMEY